MNKTVGDDNSSFELNEGLNLIAEVKSELFLVGDFISFGSLRVEDYFYYMAYLLGTKSTSELVFNLDVLTTFILFRSELAWVRVGANFLDFYLL